MTTTDLATAPPERRPIQPLSQPSDEKTTITADGWRQIWRQYGWIDHQGRMYDLTEPAPSTYRVASFSPLWVLVDNEPVPEPDPTPPRTPAEALRWARDRLAAPPADVELSVLQLLGAWADELDTAPALQPMCVQCGARAVLGVLPADPVCTCPPQPRWGAAGEHPGEAIDPECPLHASASASATAPAVYALPAEPPETVTELWDFAGARWIRGTTPRSWRYDDGPAEMNWAVLLAGFGPLSTTPPAGTEAQHG